MLNQINSVPALLIDIVAVTSHTHPEYCFPLKISESYISLISYIAVCCDPTLSTE